MSKDNMDFTPERVEHQIDLLVQFRASRSTSSSDAQLISELYSAYEEDRAIVENAWERLAGQTGLRPRAGDVLVQDRSRLDEAWERPERPQHMNSNGIGMRPHKRVYRFLELCAALLLVTALVTGTIILLNSAQRKQAPGSNPENNSAAVTASATPIKTPTGTVLLADPLKENTLHLLVDAQHFFKDGAYHIHAQSLNASEAVIPRVFNYPAVAYRITMEEIAGDETTGANTFGVVLNYNMNKKIETFYAFEILNEGTSSQYGFYKYDNSKSYSWTLIGPLIKAGKEFHPGHGPGATNVVRVIEKANSFTFFVNGQQVGTASDSSRLNPGYMGMLVNLEGTEVAFSNVLITRL